MLNLLMYFYQVVIQEDEKMKKALSVLLTMGLTVSMLAGCGSNGAADNASAGNAADNSAADNTVAATESSAAAGEAKSASDIKVGVIYIGDENEGYTAAHMAGIDQMMSNLGLSEDQVVEKTLIPEDESAYDAAVDLADQGCNIIFGTSFGVGIIPHGHSLLTMKVDW